MPLLKVVSSGELESYWRRILSRVTVGTVASLIGSGLLAWGFINISVGDLKFTDAVCGCSTGSSCTVLKTLVLVCVPLLFGFSERALTSFESQFSKQVLGKQD